MPHTTAQQTTITDKFAIRVRAGYTAALILLIISYLITLYANIQLNKQSSWVNHSAKIIDHLEKTLSGIKDAETGMRGFIITNDSNNLLPYKNSFATVNNSLAQLKTEIEDDVFNGVRLPVLNNLINKRYARLDSSRKIYADNNSSINDHLISSLVIGKDYMDSIRVLVSSMEQYEQGLMMSKNKELNAKQNALNSIIITSLILAIVFIIFGFFTFKRENKARLLAEKKSEDYQHQLQQRIAELDEANKKLIEVKGSEKFAATGRIARTIAHEVRNPLTNINLAVSQIKEDLPELNESNIMLFDMVTRNSERINLLISDLLNATRFEELKYDSVSINTLLNQSLEMVKDRIELNQIKVEKKYSADICNIQADPGKIKIAFVNIMVNAIEAMEPAKGILKIITRGENDKCVIEIADNGSGMTEEELTRLFEPYYTTKNSGNGLGLTNTHNIILNHEGSIYVTSSPGKGTKFTVKFNFEEEDEN
jgi:signal transduction histidine kinase